MKILEQEKLKQHLAALKNYLEETEFPSHRAAAPVQLSASEIAELQNTDSSFTEAVLGMIDEKGLKDSEVYRKADVSRSVFNNVKNGHFSKGTAIALALTLELGLEETQKLLRKGRVVLSDSFVFDKTIIYCIIHKIYEANDVNFLLEQLGQPILREAR